MKIFDEISDESTIARVRAITKDGLRTYLEFRNGQSATVDSQQPLDLPVGAVVLVRANDNHIELAPDELWPEETWIGVVRLKLSDTTVIDARGLWKKIPTREDISYQEGNTVEASDLLGVIRVLSKDPIKFIDLPTIDETAIDKFKTQKGQRKETFEDFGGLKNVVERAKELVEVPLIHRDKLAKIGARPIRGVLFTGTPGTGKTMLARIIANNTDSVFYEISGPEILGKYYGQSEELLRKIFDDASQQEKSIIFFDEIDSLASKRDDDSHEVSRRVVAQFLTLMDGFSANKNTIVIAATNRPQDIDAALRRPGRFDWEINFPLPSLHDREEILRVSAKRLATDANLPHLWMASNTESWTAAELAAIWSEAALLAVSDERAEIMTEDYIGGFERVRAQRERAGLSISRG